MTLLFDTLNALDDVRGLIDTAVRESEILEYKTASVPFNDNDRKEIAKDVSAMANSLGGLIVYGVATDASERTKPVRIEPISVKNIETFDRVLNSQVQPPIVGVRKKLLPVDHPQVMLINIPASEDPPHQNLYDKKYYRRSGTESLPMEHDLVAMHFGRCLGPVLSLLFRLVDQRQIISDDPEFYGEATVRIFVTNNGKRVGRYVNIILRFPRIDIVRLTTKQGNLISLDRLYQEIQVRQYENNIGVFHPRCNTSVAEIGISVAREFADKYVAASFIGWTIMADEMNPREGTVSLRDIGWM